MARLADGAHRCGGRVELWSGGVSGAGGVSGGGAWGTVCDDRWDLADGHVVCGQLGCGYALNVSGQDGAFPPAAGGGPIHLDELMCTGAEPNLAVRLTGGADRCSGRVELHLNGSWGTLCDTCWDEQLAAMVCSMLGCGGGGEPEAYAHFESPLAHRQRTARSGSNPLPRAHGALGVRRVHQQQTHLLRLQGRRSRL
ncbi:hypothetical protein CRUP_037313 [Coryphaenoides rupestris]|nr:hypothetical protein CRUP_037313 [Coryphaenoides rupestris]